MVLARIVTKSAAYYNNSSWDLVDARTADSTIIAKVDKKTLPDSLRNKSSKQLQAIVDQKAGERASIQTQIQEISQKRELFINEEKAKRLKNNSNTPTLESEVQKIIKEQVQRFRMKIE